MLHAPLTGRYIARCGTAASRLQAAFCFWIHRDTEITANAAKPSLKSGAIDADRCTGLGHSWLWLFKMEGFSMPYHFNMARTPSAVKKGSGACACR